MEAGNVVRGGPTFSVEAEGALHVNMTVDEMKAAGVPVSVVLDLVKGRLKAAVDVKAEVLRSSMTTPGTGQAMEYQETQAQAIAALKSPGTATAAIYPMLAASIAIDVDPSTGKPAADVLGVARAVIASYDLWLAAGSAVRNVRLAGKKAIDEAATDEAAAAAYGAIVWPSFG